MKRFLPILLAFLWPFAARAAITLTAETSGNSSGAGPYTTASITATNNELWVACVTGVGFGAFSGNFTVSGDGLTWVSIAQVINTASNTNATQCFRAMVASGATAGTLSITTPQSLANAYWIIFKASGTDTGGTNGSSAVYQSNTNQGQASGGGATNFNTTLGTFFDATNDVTVLAWFANAGPTFTDTVNQTQLTYMGAGTTDNYIVSYANPPTTPMSNKYGAGSFEVINTIAFELKVPGGGASCTHAGYTSAGALATPNGSTGSYLGKTGAFVTPDCSTVQYWQPSLGNFGTN